MTVGTTYVPSLDGPRLAEQAQAVHDHMEDGAWHTLAEIHAATGAPEASASARLRDLRRVHGRTIERRRRGDPSAGLWEYRMVAP